jgi:carboxymethylenebutenolidase
MGGLVQLTAADGHKLDAYIVQPGVSATAGVVIVQEIFGVNKHIRDVADRYAEEGFVVIAPALFDRIERGVELDYGPEDRQRAMGMLKSFNMDRAVDDIAAAVQFVRGFGHLKVGVVGFCLGGTVAWVAASRLRVDAAVGYYGGRIAQYVKERPKAPVMLHFGDLDDHIPQSDIELIEKEHPRVQVYHYPAGHAFNRDGGPTYDASSAIRARERTLAFLHEELS